MGHFVETGEWRQKFNTFNIMEIQFNLLSDELTIKSFNSNGQDKGTSVVDYEFIEVKEFNSNFLCLVSTSAHPFNLLSLEFS